MFGSCWTTLSLLFFKESRLSILSILLVDSPLPIPFGMWCRPAPLECYPQLLLLRQMIIDCAWILLWRDLSKTSKSAFTLLWVFLNSPWKYSVNLFVYSCDAYNVFLCLSLIAISFGVHFLFSPWSVGISFPISFLVHSSESPRDLVAATWLLSQLQRKK